jgi:hypothetical protein
VTGHITLAEGSFDTGTVVTSECSVACPIVNGQVACPANPVCGAATANHYSLQLNTKPFDTSVCSTSPFKTNGPSGTPSDKCQGWGAIRLPVWRRRRHPVLAVGFRTGGNQLPGAEGGKLPAEQCINRRMVSVSIHEHRTGLLRRQRAFRHGGAGRTHHLASQPETHGLRRRRQRRHDR